MEESAGADARGPHPHLREVEIEVPATLYDFPVDLLAGGLLGGFAHSVVAPIERAKLVLQTQNVNAAISRSSQYKGMMDAMFRIAREEGVLSLWRGNGISVLRYYPSVMLNFAFKDYYRNCLSPTLVAGVDLTHREKWQTSIANFSAGAMAGATSLLVTYPLDMAHTRLATDVGSRRQFNGLGSFLATIYRRQGIHGLYQGFPASVQGIIVHRAVYFGGFDTAKLLLLGDDESGSFFGRWALAQVSTTAAGLIAYPLDTVRHRMMMQAGMAEEMYSSTLDCWKKILKKEGISGFYKGCLSNMFRGAGSAFILVTYDEIKWFLKRNLR